MAPSSMKTVSTCSMGIRRETRRKHLLVQGNKSERKFSGVKGWHDADAMIVHLDDYVCSRKSGLPWGGGVQQEIGVWVIVSYFKRHILGQATYG